MGSEHKKQDLTPLIFFCFQCYYGISEGPKSYWIMLEGVRSDEFKRFNQDSEYIAIGAP